MARSLISRAGRCHFWFILKVIMSCAEERSGWSHIASLFFMHVDRTVHRKKASYARLRSDHTTLEESQLKGEYAKIELAKYAAQHGIWRL